MKNISKKEEYQRSAVGRFYYAAFGLVKNYYEDKYYLVEKILGDVAKK